MGWLGDIAAFGSLAAGAYNMFKGNDEPEGYDEMRQLAAERAQYSRALTNPDDPMFKKLYEEENTKLGREFAQNVKDLQTAMRRAKNRNFGMDLVDPERRDEMVMKAFTTDRETRRDRARTNVRSYLSAALGQNAGAAAAYAPVVNVSANINAAKRQNMASGVESLFSGAKYLDQRMGSPGWDSLNPQGTQAWFRDTPNIEERYLGSR